MTGVQVKLGPRWGSVVWGVTSLLGLTPNGGLEKSLVEGRKKFRALQIESLKGIYI
jgi:hypothetical protein